MKTGTIFLLVVFITLGMEMVWSQRASRGESAEGVLPEGGEGSEPSFRPGGGALTAEWSTGIDQTHFF